MRSKNSTFIVAPGFDQDNTAFEKMVFPNKNVDLLK